MEDQSALDNKYFIDNKVFNCPFCNRRNVIYRIRDMVSFNWNTEKECYVYLAECTSCGYVSMHLSYENISEMISGGYMPNLTYHFEFKHGINIDSSIFYSQPTSFFVVDKRIPRVLRELITEADGCLKMNFLTGASACARKAIYELLTLEQISADSYEQGIKSLKERHPDSDPRYFDILSHIQNMTSNKIHEQSWPKWDSANLRLLIETLKTILHDIYVLPGIKKDRLHSIEKLQAELNKDKK